MKAATWGVTGLGVFSTMLCVWSIFMAIWASDNNGKFGFTAAVLFCIAVPSLVIGPLLYDDDEAQKKKAMKARLIELLAEREDLVETLRSQHNSHDSGCGCPPCLHYRKMYLSPDQS